MARERATRPRAPPFIDPPGYARHRPEEGTIFEIHEDGRVTPFVTDAQLVSSVGIEVDEPRDRLLVANSDRAAFQPGNTGQAKLGVYSLTTGERLAMVDLAAVIGTPSDPPRYFANDVTVDSDGNVYVTDTMMNVIYKVTPDYQASVLHRFADLQGPQLNGIVHHANGYLLVVAGQDTYKVPVANPAGTSKVAVTDPVGGQDGIVWTADGHSRPSATPATCRKWWRSRAATIGPRRGGPASRGSWGRPRRRPQSAATSGPSTRTSRTPTHRVSSRHLSVTRFGARLRGSAVLSALASAWARGVTADDDLGNFGEQSRRSRFSLQVEIEKAQ